MPLAHDIELFADPWEHVRMLSDAGRNGALLSLLRRRAPGARVLEIGSGTGLWAVAAARLGARRVLAVEPTPLVAGITELVQRNGLSDRVEVVNASLEELDPEPMDLVFSELLNADPFAEGLLETSVVARDWLAPDAHLAPRRLSILAQAAYAPEVLDEVSAARASISGIAAQLGLDLAPLLELMQPTHAELGLGSEHALVGESVIVWSLELGVDTELESVRLELPARSPANAVVLWFEAELDEGIRMANPPGMPGHWGQLVARFARTDRNPRIVVHFDGDSIAVERTS